MFTQSVPAHPYTPAAPPEPSPSHPHSDNSPESESKSADSQQRYCSAYAQTASFHPRPCIADLIAAPETHRAGKPNASLHTPSPDFSHQIGSASKSQYPSSKHSSPRYPPCSIESPDTAASSASESLPHTPAFPYATALI